MVAMQLVGLGVYEAYRRARPFGVTTIGRWAGYSAPAAPVAMSSIVLVSVAYCLVVPGRPRTCAKWAAGLTWCARRTTSPSVTPPCAGRAT